MKVVINITKKSLFILCFMLVAATSILLVYAVPPTSPQSVGSAIYGHTASELNPGAFGFGDGSWYIFLNPVHIHNTLLLGKVGAGQQQGLITLQSGPAADVNKNINIDNTYGDFRVSNNAWAEIFRVENDGDVNVKDGAGIKLGGIKKTSWPAGANIPSRGLCYAHTFGSYSPPSCDAGYTSVLRHRARCDDDNNQVAIGSDLAAYSYNTNDGTALSSNGYQCDVWFELCCASSL